MRENQQKIPCADSAITYCGGEYMREKVYNHIAANPGTTVHSCAKVLNIAELSALSLINELCKDGIISLSALPLGNAINPDCSSFYSVCKPYIERTAAQKRHHAKAFKRQKE